MIIRLIRVSLLCLVTEIGRAQCPDLAVRYSQFNQLNTGDSAVLMRGEPMLATWQRCGFGGDSVTAKLIHTLGRCYWYAGDLVKGERYTRMAIRINSRPSSLARPANLANSYTNLGQILMLQGQYRRALDVFNQAIGVARRYPDKVKTGAVACEKRATAFDYLGDYEQAAESARLGYSMARQARDTTMQVRNRIGEAQAYARLGQLERADRLIRETLPIAELLNNPTDLANMFSLAAVVSANRKQVAATIRFYERALILHKQSGNGYGCWQTLVNEAYVLQQEKQSGRASALLVRAEPYAVTPVEKALLKAYRSQSVLAVGEPIRALTLVREALSGFGIRYPSSHPDSVGIRLTDQKEYLLTVLRIEGDILTRLAHQTQQAPYWQQARRTYALADYVIDLMRWEHTGQQSKLYWRETTHSLYEKAIAICYQLKDVSGAYYFMEKSRAVLLTDNLNELGARQQLPPKLAEQEQSLNRSVASLRSQLASQKSGTSAYNRILADLLLAQEKSDAFVRQMEKTNPLYYRYRYDNAIRPLAEVRTWLRKHNQSVVSYFVGDSALYVLGVTPAGNRLLRQPIGEYTCGLKNWLSLLNNPTALNSQLPWFLQNGADLYHLLLAPLQLPKGRVVVSPDGFFLPFEVLTRSRSAQNPDYLVHSYAFSYVYSVNRLLAEPAVTTTQTQFLGMAPLRFARIPTQSALPDLPGSVESLERVGRHYFMPTLLRGSDATRSEFRALAPTATVVQLFTHADADTLRREPVIYFADSSLYLSDLQTGPAFKTQLLVLSACRTGVGSHQKGEGVFSLARGFAALGVPSMLTTLWSVENQPTYTLTESFYDLLAAGETKDIALQRAKQDWLRTASRSNQLPHIWAGLILIGDSGPLRQQGLAMATLWVGGSLAGGLLLLLLVAVGYNRKRMGRDKAAQRKNRD